MVACDNTKCGASWTCLRYALRGRTKTKTFDTKKDWKNGDMPLDLCEDYLKLNEEDDSPLPKKNPRDFYRTRSIINSASIDLSSRRTTKHYPHDEN